MWNGEYVLTLETLHLTKLKNRPRSYEDKRVTGFKKICGYHDR